ncbi:Alpha/Beta hydrolase protein [Tricharina praecox]|uniref:Alpha/Beta hydrolase protein n=1 Tax=Tricharina praecox TaxID=43433 RepID=UPI00221ECCCE|nr:Alpha/Beta hydrolase protein [Tricharina praecox]KAI5851963.1 Alpha/Beta hydrolase protein [Tricharina praecox]
MNTTTTTTEMLSPPSPPRSRARSPHRHSHQTSGRPRREGGSRRRSAPNHILTPGSTAASSPEVITSLVDQLSKLQPSPLHNPFLYGSLAPREEIVDAAMASDDETGGYLHPDDAAMAPVVRTSKPPSGFSTHTKNESLSHSRRSSHHSGISVGTKGGVDIPSYVRTYMNRGPDHERRQSRDSNVSGQSGDKSGSGRLSVVSSRERMRNAEGKRPVARASAGGKDIPQRSSSYGKGSDNPRSQQANFPDAIVTTAAPIYKSPIGSPNFPTTAEFDDSEAAPPPPDLAKYREELKGKRGSKGFPTRSESLPSGKISKRHSADAKVKGTVLDGFAKRKSDSQYVPPHGYIHMTTTTTTTTPPRPSFQGSTADTLQQERPGSADSIDDAVDAYLCSPRLSQKIRMPTTGRTISFSEVGDPQGFAVFVCVGMGLTRYVTAFYDELALTLGLRLITPDRPGVGESDSIDENERAVLNWPDDVLYICQSLKITKFSILAHSAGAIYALATALRMPGHIRGKIHLLAPWIPPSQMESVIATDENKGERPGSIPTSQRILRALPTPFLKAANSPFMSATSSSLTTSLPRNSARRTKRRAAAAAAPQKIVDPSAAKDRPTLTTNHQPSGNGTDPPGDDAASPPAPEDIEASLLLAAITAAQEKERQSSYDERLTCAIWTLSTRNANPAVDLLVCLERNRPVGFMYVDITREVVIHHGAKDARVPVDNVRWLGKTMRRCEVRVLPTEGHGLMASASVMGGVLEEIAQEWRDWRKVVEGRRVEGGPGGRERRWAD